MAYDKFFEDARKWAEEGDKADIRNGNKKLAVADVPKPIRKEDAPNWKEIGERYPAPSFSPNTEHDFQRGLQDGSFWEREEPDLMSSIRDKNLQWQKDTGIDRHVKGFEDFLKGSDITPNIIGMGQAVEDIVRAADGKKPNEPLPWLQELRKTKQEAADRYRDYVGNDMAANILLQGGEMANNMIASAITAPFLGVGAGTAMNLNLATQGGLDTASQDIRNGRDFNKAMFHGLTSGGTSYLVESLGGIGATPTGQKITSKVLSSPLIQKISSGLSNVGNGIFGNKLSQVLGKWLSEAAGEGFEEGIEYPIQQALTSLIYDEDLELNDKEWLENVIIGAGVGGLFGLPGAVVNAPNAMVDDALENVLTKETETETVIDDIPQEIIDEVNNAERVPNNAEIDNTFEENEGRSPIINDFEERTAEKSSTAVTDNNVGDIDEQLLNPFGEEGKREARDILSKAEDKAEAYIGVASFYNAGMIGKDTTDMPKHGLTPEQQARAYKAGALDQNASTAKQKANKAYINKAKGFAYDAKNIAHSSIDKRTARELDTIGKALGVKIEVNEQVGDGMANGSYSNGVIQVAKDTQNKPKVVMSHETTHRMQELSPDEYKIFRDYAVQQALEAEGENAIENERRLYAQSDVNLDFEGAQDEIAAEYAEKLMDNTDLFADLVNNNRTVAEKFLDAIKDIIKRIKTFLKSLTDAEARETREELAKLEKGAKLWQDMLKASVKNVENADTSTDTSTNTSNDYSLDKNKETIAEETNEELEFDPYKMFFDEEYRNAYTKQEEMAKQKEAEKAKADNGVAQFGLSESQYPAELQFKSKDGKYIKELEGIIEDSKKTGLLNWNNTLYQAFSGMSDVAKLQEMKVDYQKKLAEAKKMIEQRKAEGYKGKSKQESYNDYKQLKRELYSSYAEEKGDVLYSHRVGEDGIRFWQIQKNDSMKMLDMLETAEKIAKRKNYAESKETTKQGKFSLKKPVEETKDLIAIHNTFPDNLMKSLKLGGFPMPSLAILKHNMLHSNFGPISLIFGKETIDPKSDKRNIAYSADAWTPVFPRIEYEVNPKVEEKLSSLYQDLQKRRGDSFARPLYSVANTLQDSVSRNKYGVDGIIEDLANDIDVKQIYLDQMGEEPEPTVKKQTVERIGKEKQDKFDFYVQELGTEAFEELVHKPGKAIFAEKKEWAEKHGDDFRKAFEKYNRSLGYSEEMVKDMLESLSNGRIIGEALDIRNYLRNGGEKITETVDREKLIANIESRVDDKEFRKWLNGLFDGVILSEGIYNNKDFYTPSGNQRSFKQLHYPVTLENIVKAMAGQNEGKSKNVAGFAGTKTVRAETAKEFKSIDEMHENEARLQNLSEEKFESILQSLDNRLSNSLTDVFNSKLKHDSYENIYVEIDRAGTILQEAIGEGKITPKSLASCFAKYDYKISKETAQELSNLIDDIANMPTAFFEAKPQRAVGFDEVRAAIVPSDTSAELRSALEEVGVPILEYETGNDTDRLAKVNSVENVRFSLKKNSQGDNLTENQAKYFKDSKVVDENGNLRVVYHGTGKEFYTFDEDKIGDNWGQSEGGFFFTQNKQTAKNYAYLATNGDEEKQRIVEAYLNITDPYISNSPGSIPPIEFFDNNRGDILREAKNINENDGIIIKGTGEYKGKDLYIAFYPNQIKSIDNLNPTDDPDIRYSLKKVKPVEPTSDKWERSATFDEVKAIHPTLFELEADESEKRNPTQVTGTLGTYRKIYNMLQSEGFNGTILDASSGLGIGTRAGREEYGFSVDDIEPFPDKSYTPKYTDYSKHNKKYDVIISNAVLNVLPQDLRDDLTVKMGQMLNDGGRLFVNVRGTDVKNASSKIPINEDQMEYFISGSGSYQKGFTKAELVAYLEDALGDEFDVQATNKFGAVPAIVTKKSSEKYSLKGAKEQHAEYEALKKENDSLKAAVRLWRSNKDKITVDTKEVHKETRKLLNDYSATIKTSNVENDVQSLYEYMANKGTNFDYAEAKTRADEIASKIINSALITEDTYYEQYEDLRDYVRKANFEISEQDASNIADYDKWRKRHFGKFNIKKGKTNIDQIYGELSELWPEFFDEETETTPSDQLVHIAEVMESIYDVVQNNPFEDNMKETIDEVGSQIMIDFFSMPQTKWISKKLYDKKVAAFEQEKEKAKLTGMMAQGRIDAKRARTAEKNYQKELSSVKEQLEKEKKLAEEEKDLALLAGMMAQGRKDASMARTMQRHHERAIAKVRNIVKEVRKDRDTKLDNLKEKQAKSNEARRERAKAKETRAKILRHVKALNEKLLRPSDKKHIPEELKLAVADLLNSINLESQYSYDENGKRVKGKNGDPTKKTEAFRNLRDAYEQILGDEKSGAWESMSIDPDLLANIRDIEKWADTPIDAMNSEQLETIWKAVRAIEASVSNANKAFGIEKYKELSALMNAIRDYVYLNKDKGDWAGALRGLDKLINADMLTPQAFFHMFGEGGDALFENLRRGQDNFISGLDEAARITKDIIGDTDISKLEKKTHTFNLEHGKLTLSTAQVMALYAYMKREQAVKHIYGGGIRPDVIKNEKGLKETAPADAIQLNEEEKEVDYITSVLTAEQKEIADKFVDVMSNWLSSLGNEASMEVYGYEKFLEKNYIPIKSDKSHLNRDVGKEAQAGTIAGRGFSKGTNPNANNPIMVSSIFDIFANHVVEMVEYSAYLAPLENLRRAFNFTFRDAEGNPVETVQTMRAAIEKVLGKKGNSYADQLLDDLNQGVRSKGTGNPFNVVGNVKAAAVAANLRVLLQQPTAILRALDTMDIKYLIDGFTTKADWKKVKRYAPIAVWKDWGFFDINTGRQMKNILYDNDSKFEKFKQAGMAPAGMADSFAWSHLWNAAEAEIKDKNKALVPDTDAFYEAVAKRFNEIIDKTQVVDGILQRSGIMRNPDGLAKMATSFMGEPTKVYNMFRSAVYDYKNNKTEGNKKHLERTLMALTLSFMVNAVAQAIPDAARDDDREKDYWEKFTKKYFENFAENYIPFGYIPYVKDVWSMLQGYSAKRMDMDSIDKTIKATENVIKALQGDSKMTMAAAFTNFASEVSRLFGIPLANVKRDLRSVLNTVANETDNYLLQYRIDRASLNLGYSGNTSQFIDILYNAYKSDRKAYEIIYDDMIKNGVDESKIKNGMERRMKQEQGVESVEDLENRFLSPSDEKAYTSSYSKATNNLLYRNATSKEKRNIKDKIFEYATDDKYAAEIKHSDAVRSGIAPETYIVIKETSKGIKGIDNGKGGTYYLSSSLKKMDYVYSIPGLSQAQRNVLFEELDVSEKVRHYNKNAVKEKLRRMQ